MLFLTLLFYIDQQMVELFYKQRHLHMRLLLYVLVKGISDISLVKASYSQLVRVKNYVARYNAAPETPSMF